MLRVGTTTCLLPPARSQNPEPELGGSDEHGHVPVRVLVLVHELMRERDLAELKRARQARVDASLENEVVHPLRLFVIREVRSLQALLPHPQVPQVDGRVVAGRSGADDDHATRLAREDRRRDRRLARVLEDEVRAPLVADGVPYRLAELAHALQPVPVADRVLPVGKHSPVVEIVAVDAALRPQVDAVLVLVLARDNRDRRGPMGLRDLDGHRPEAARAAPHEDHVVLLQPVRRPAEEHPVRGRPDERVRGGRLPGEVLGPGHTLVGLHLRELGEAPPVRLVAPYPEGRRVHRIDACLHHRTVAAPHAAVNDDFVPFPGPRDVLADLVDDARRVAPADVEVFLLAGLLARRDDVNRHSERRPDIVVVDSRRHHVDEHFVVGDLRCFHDFELEALCRWAETLFSHGERVHPGRDMAERGRFGDGVQNPSSRTFSFRASVERQDSRTQLFVTRER